MPEQHLIKSIKDAESLLGNIMIRCNDTVGKYPNYLTFLLITFISVGVRRHEHNAAQTSKD